MTCDFILVDRVEQNTPSPFMCPQCFTPHWYGKKWIKCCFKQKSVILKRRQIARYKFRFSEREKKYEGREMNVSTNPYLSLSDEELKNMCGVLQEKIRVCVLEKNQHMLGIPNQSIIKIIMDSAARTQYVRRR